MHVQIPTKSETLEESLARIWTAEYLQYNQSLGAVPGGLAVHRKQGGGSASNPNAQL